MTLIEVLISIVLLSIGLIGLLGLLTTSMQSSSNAQDRNKAALLANEMVSAMWLNNSTDITTTPLSTEYAAWKASINNMAAGGLYPNAANATGTVAVNNNIATITITWSPPNQSASKTSNTMNNYGVQVVNNTYTTQVVLK